MLADNAGSMLAGAGGEEGELRGAGGRTATEDSAKLRGEGEIGDGCSLS